jgi:hypothetical protein
MTKSTDNTSVRIPNDVLDEALKTALLVSVKEQRTVTRNQCLILAAEIGFKELKKKCRK